MTKTHYRVKMVGIKRSRLLIFWLPLLAVLLAAGNGQGKGLRYSGSFTGQEKEDDRFEKSHQQAVSLGLDHQPTDRIKIGEYLRYSYTDSDSGDKREQINQGVNLSLDNTLIATRLSAVSTLNLIEGERQGTEQSVQLGTASNWENDLVPAVTLDLGGRATENEGEALSRHSDTENRFARFGADWRRGSLGLLYDLNWQDSSIRGGEFEENGLSQSAELSYRKAFQRVYFSLKQGYQVTSRESVFRGSAASSVLPSVIAGARTGTDDPPDDFDDSTLVNNNALLDGNFSLSAYNVATGSDANNILLALNDDRVDLVYLYTETDLGATAPPGLTWTMYTNNILGTDWSPVPLAPAAVSYNRAEQRFEIEVGGIGDDYLKLVLDISLFGPAIRFTEVQALRRFSSVSGGKESSRESEASTTDLGLNVIITENWSAQYSANFDLTSSETDDSGQNDSEEIGQTASLRYQSPDRSLRSNLSLTDNAKEEDRAGSSTDRVLRTYAYDMNKEFLPTLQAGMGVQKSESYTDSILESERVSFRIDASAVLYPDLNLDFQANHTESTNVRLSTDSDNQSVQLGLVSRLRPGMTLTFREAYTAAAGDDSYTSDFFFNWQISRALSFAGGLVYSTGEDREDELNMNGTVNLGLTENILVQTSYNRIESDDTSESGTAKLNWHARKQLNFEGGCDYTNNPQSTPRRDFRVFARANLNFSVP